MTLEKGNGSKRNIPKIYTIHSQKGGVGKTSIAIAIAGLEAFFNDRKVILIDGDLTGTSIKDVIGKTDGESESFLNELILASPEKFSKWTDLGKNGRDKAGSGLGKFIRETRYKEAKNISFIPSDPNYKAVKNITGLISQEDYTRFFRLRFEDLIAKIIRSKKAEVVIIDLPPGFYGLSKNICDMTMDQFHESKKSRLSRLIHGGIDEDKKNIDIIEAHAILVTSSDSPDYKSIFPGFSGYLDETFFSDGKDSIDDIQRFFFKEETDSSGKKKQNSPINIDFLFNKMTPEPGEREQPEMFENIFNDLKESKYGGDRNYKCYSELVKYVDRKLKKSGVNFLLKHEVFSMIEILNVISRNLFLKKEKGENDLWGGMTEWCRGLAAILGFQFR